MQLNPKQILISVHSIHLSGCGPIGCIMPITNLKASSYYTQHVITQWLVILSVDYRCFLLPRQLLNISLPIGMPTSKLRKRNEKILKTIKLVYVNQLW